MIHKFTGFADHIFTFPDPAAAADRVELSSNDYSRVGFGIHHDVGEHAGGGGFTVCSADTDGVLKMTGQDP